MPDEVLQFPCYALFLDPANALIIKGKDVGPYRDIKGNEDPQRLVPKAIMTTKDINQSNREIPKGDVTVWIPGNKTSKNPVERAPRPLVIDEEVRRELRKHGDAMDRSLIHKSINDAVRIGVGEFVKNYGDGGVKESRVYNRELEGPLTLDKILNVGGDESWGPVTRNDPIVWVTIF
jgi:hypothetical protein